MAPTDTPAQGAENDPTTTETPTTNDPFAGQRQNANPFAENGDKTEALAGSAPTSPVDRRTSTDEWDAAKTPPSRFQQRKGSVYATPGSRDGHVDKNYARDAKFHELVEKKYGSGGKSRPSGAEDKS